MTLGLLAAGVAFAGELAVSAYWQDHMVLQRGKPITVWGKDAAGRAVTIAFAGQTAAAVAGDDGFWETTFAQPFAMSAAPRTLTITDDAGEVISLADILVGDVFLAAGQSNMDRRLDDTVKSYHEPRAVKEFCRDDDGIRFIRIARSAEKTDGKEQLFDLPPHKAVNDKIKYFGEGYDWSPATGTNRNYVSSLALNFARYIRDANAAKGQDIPIGIVHASSGGTAIRQWLSAAALGANGYAAESTDGWFWNNMIAPIQRTKFCAVLWYQGCSDAERRPEEYKALMDVLVRDWRGRWGENGDLPFYAVQIGTPGYVRTGWIMSAGLDHYPAPTESASGSNYVRVREGQRLWDLSDTGTHGLAVIIDHVRCMGPLDLHPEDKNFIARRLSLFARRDIYGEPELLAEGPVFSRAVREPDGAVRIYFKPGTAKGLTSGRLKMAGEMSLSRFVKMSGPVRGFALCGEDGVWHDAEATVEGETVVLRAEGIVSPTRFHYGYWCLTRFDDMEFGQRLSLYNGEGLPMSPLPPMDVEDADPGAKTSTAVADKEPNIPSAPPIPEPLWSMGPYDPSAWKPLAHNLLAAKTGVTTGNLAWAPVSKELANLTDGAVPGTPDNGRIVGFCRGSAVSWDFDEPQTIEQIRISTRCGENNNTQFSGLRIEDVYVRKSGSPDWEPLCVPMYQKGGPAKGAMVAILADDGIGRLADNVVGLKIVFGQGEGYAHYLAEIEASGHAERFGFVFSWGCVSNEEDARAYAAIGVTDIFAKGAEGHAAAKRHGLRTYCGFGPHGNGRQGLTPEQQKHFDYLSATDLRKQKMNGKELDTIVNARLGTAKCQFGGEPVSSPDLCPDLIDCFLGDTDCVKSFGALEKTLMENQEADGIAFDYIGYTNLRSCECDGCKARLAAWLAENGLEENEVSRNRFFREGLVNYINALVTEAKRIRPGIKVAIHLYPAFLPDPLYGKDLKADYVQETVAWYFAWPEEKIADYTRKILSSRHYPGSVSVPFVGLNADSHSPLPMKTPERLEAELRLILANGGNSLAVCNGGDMLKPGYREIFMKYAIPAAVRESVCP